MVSRNYSNKYLLFQYVTLFGLVFVEAV